MVRGEKKNWKMLVIKYLMPLKKWESIDVIDGSICLDGRVYQDKSLRAHGRVAVLEYRETITIFDNAGRFIVELMKEAPGFSDSAPKGIRDESGALERYEISKLIDLMDKVLTGCFCDPDVKKSYKERIRSCMVKRIDEIYKNSIHEEDSSRSS